jgi:hypothetical protein
MLRSLSGLARLGWLLPCSTRISRGDLVAGLAIGMPDRFSAACKGSQTLSVSVGRFGWEPIARPVLSRKLPNNMATTRMALTMRASDLESHLISGVKPKTDRDCAQAPLY